MDVFYAPFLCPNGTNALPQAATAVPPATWQRPDQAALQAYAQQVVGQTFELDAQESHHCIKVMRHTAGQSIQVVNGQGSLWQASITTPHPKKTSFVLQALLRQAPFPAVATHVALAPTKNLDRIEWLTEKATELGLDYLSFFTSRHSERKQLKPERLYKKLVSALKQSGRLWLPQLTPLVPFAELVQSLAPVATGKYMGYVSTDPLPHLQNLVAGPAGAAPGTLEDAPAAPPTEAAATQPTTPPTAHQVVLIGPEGDFHALELALAQQVGFKWVSLGPNRLRTETAALAAAHILTLAR